MRIRRPFIATLVALILLASTGCAAHTPHTVTTADKLLGTWYDGQTGAQYGFSSDGMLVVPTPQPGNGNAVVYKVLGDDQLDVITGSSHRVSNIATVTPNELVLADPISGHRQLMFRSAGSTRYASRLLYAAMSHLSQAASTTAMPDIVWATRRPLGKGNEWTAWSPTTLDAYLHSWDWTGLRRAAAPTATVGGGQNMGFSFAVQRQVQTDASLTASWQVKSIVPTAGLPVIDVGYSAAKATYPAGTLVYLPGGMIYSLGDGYAIAVGRDVKTKTFVPLTHR